MEENNPIEETPEQSRRRKISETKKRKFAENGSPLKGRAKSEEHKAAIGAANFGKRRTPEQKAKIQAAVLAAGVSDETRLAAADRMRSNPFRNLPKSESHRAAISRGRKGKSRLLRKYGIEPEEYAKRIARGERWCSEGKHFVLGSSMHPRRNFCPDCKQAHHRHTLLRTKYGVSPQWYDQKLAEQGGGCAMCGHAEPAKGRNFLSVDHSHTTQETRGILCHRCNIALGFIEDADFQRRAAAYLAQYGTILRVEEIPMEPA